MCVLEICHSLHEAAAIYQRLCMVDHMTAVDHMAMHVTGFILPWFMFLCSVSCRTWLRNGGKQRQQQ